jgi:ribosome assembly protein YihI (activator of Der GTPase)
MPSKSESQRRLMAAASHDPTFAKKAGVPVSVAQEFNQADKGRGKLPNKHVKKSAKKLKRNSEHWS